MKTLRSVSKIQLPIVSFYTTLIIYRPKELPGTKGIKYTVCALVYKKERKIKV